MCIRDSGSVRAILDWELATLGHPLADVAYLCMPYEIPPFVAGPLSGFRGLNLDKHGVPPLEDLVGAYAEKLRDEAARHAASAADASQGLEREAEMAWREAETWVEREEALERREAYAHESALGDAEQIAAPSPRSWPSSASSSALSCA